MSACTKSGVGFASARTICTDGCTRETHPLYNTYVRCQLSGCTSFYAVFDAHCGPHAASFASARLQEILTKEFGSAFPGNDKEVDERVKCILRKAILSIESAYLKSVKQLVNASRTKPDRNREERLVSSTSLVIALIHKRKLYVCNVGNSRALLCKTDPRSVSLLVKQLSTDHDLTNDDEIIRLSQMGVSHTQLEGKWSNMKGLTWTRCIGNYEIKTNYRAVRECKDAREQPVICEPDVCDAIELDETCRFLLLMSRAVCDGDDEQVNRNKYITQTIVSKLNEHKQLHNVAQSAIEQISSTCQKSHDDLVLIIRMLDDLTCDEAETSNESTLKSNQTSIQSDTVSLKSDSDDISKSDNHKSPQKSPARVKAYVDFSDFYNNVDVARLNGTLPITIDFD